MSEANAAATSHLRILQHQRRRPAPTVIEVSATYGIDRGERFQCGQVCGPSHSTDMGTPREALERATVTVDEAALILGITRTTTYESVRRGEIPARRFGRRVVVLRHELLRLLDSPPTSNELHQSEHRANA